MKFLLIIVIFSSIIIFLFLEYINEKNILNSEEKKRQEFIKNLNSKKESVKKENLLFLYGLLQTDNKAIKIKKVLNYSSFKSMNSDYLLIITYENGAKRLKNLFTEEISYCISLSQQKYITGNVDSFWWIEPNKEFLLEDLKKTIYKTFNFKEKGD